MKTVILLFVFSSLLCSLPVQAKQLQIDLNHSSLGFVATHLKISKIPGRFSKFEGSIDLDESDITKSKVEVMIDVASIFTAVDKRDEHLRSADFFDVKKFPEATFRSTSLKKKGKEFEMVGDLTIKGVTKKVTLAVLDLGQVEDPMMKINKHIFSASGTINRKDFGVSYGPDAVVGDLVALMLNLETMPPQSNN